MGWSYWESMTFQVSLPEGRYFSGSSDWFIRSRIFGILSQILGIRCTALISSASASHIYRDLPIDLSDWEFLPFPSRINLIKCMALYDVCYVLYLWGISLNHPIDLSNRTLSICAPSDWRRLWWHPVNNSPEPYHLCDLIIAIVLFMMINYCSGP